jgi:hypothetical protein
MITRSLTTLAAVAALALGAAAPAAIAKHGADDPPTHVRGGGGADDPATHDARDDKGGTRGGKRRGADDNVKATASRHGRKGRRRGRGADDGPNHVRRSRGADDGPGHVRHSGNDDGPNHT